MKKYFVYATSTGRVYYCTSPHRAEAYLKKILEGNDCAAFQGERFVDPDQLVRVAHGIYRRLTARELEFWR